MPNASELVHLGDLKAYLQQTTTTFDAILTSIKGSVEAWVKNYCRDPFLVTTYTEYYDGNGGNAIHVRHYPITEITEVNIDSDRDFAAATAVAVANIISSDQNNSEGVVELFDEVFSEGQKNVKIVYKAGYATIPEDLQLAVKIICSREFMIHDKKMAGVVSQSVSDRTFTVDLEQIPRDAYTILQAYRRALV